MFCLLCVCFSVCLCVCCVLVVDFFYCLFLAFVLFCVVLLSYKKNKTRQTKQLKTGCLAVCLNTGDESLDLTVCFVLFGVCVCFLMLFFLFSVLVRFVLFCLFCFVPFCVLCVLFCVRVFFRFVFCVLLFFSCSFVCVLFVHCV